MHSQMKRHDVQLLLRAGHTQEQVHEITGISVRSIRRIQEEDPVADFDDRAARKRSKVGRPSKVEPYISWIVERIAADPELMTLELLRLARQKGYDGGKSQFYEAVRELRPKQVRPQVRFDGLPGEFSQHDFGQVDVRYLDGSKKRVHFFVTRLKWSRWARVTIVPDQRVESLVRPLVKHFDAMGGVPLMAVFDRPKTIAIKWKKDGEVTEWNSTFIQVMAELRVGVELCWPYRANQKGSAENLVKWVKGSFFKQRRFLDDEDMLQQLEEWHHHINEERPSRATNVIPVERLAQEQERFRSLRVGPEDLYLRFPVQVGPTGIVRFDGRRYSMPPEAIGIPGTLYLGESHVRITAGRYRAEHGRVFEPGGQSILPEHRTAMVAAVSGKRGRLYLKRQQILELGQVALDYLTEVVHRRPRTWKHDVEKIHESLVAFGDQWIMVAMQRALHAETYGAEYVDYQLEQLASEVTGFQQEMWH